MKKSNLLNQIYSLIKILIKILIKLFLLKYKLPTFLLEHTIPVYDCIHNGNAETTLSRSHALSMHKCFLFYQISTQKLSLLGSKLRRFQQPYQSVMLGNYTQK